MFTKKLNTFILIASQILNFAIIMFFAVLLAKLVWWLINPTISDVYVEKMSATQFDNSAKYVVNRYPFGIITKAKVAQEAPPAIVDQIKLTGLYHSNDKDSMALIEVSGKTMVFKIGSLIMNSATVKAIGSDQITVSEDGRIAVVKISNGSGTPGVVAPTNSVPSFGGNQSNQPPPNSAPPTQSPSEVNAVNDFKERRKKMIEEFAQQRGNASSHSDTGNNQGNNNQAGAEGGNNNNTNSNTGNGNNANPGNNEQR